MIEMVFEKLTYISASWTLALDVPFAFIGFLNLVACLPVHSWPQVVGSPWAVVATVGNDFILPCRVEPRLNVEKLTVEWWKPDVPPDPGDLPHQHKYVHRYHDNRDDEDMKMPSYAGRTALFTDALKHGNVSLKITKAKLSDQGDYICILPQLESPVRATVVRFVVETRLVESSMTEMPLQTLHSKNKTDTNGGGSDRSRLIPLASFCVLLISGGGYYIKQKCHKQGLMTCDAPVKPLLI